MTHRHCRVAGPGDGGLAAGAVLPFTIQQPFHMGGVPAADVLREGGRPDVVGVARERVASNDNQRIRQHKIRRVVVFVGRRAAL